MAEERRRRYYEYDDDIRLPVQKKTGNNKTLILVFLGAGIAFLLLMCLLAGGVAAIVAMSQGTQPDEFVGRWKGRWTIAGDTFDSFYTFNKDGTFREDSFDLQGFPKNISTGRWQFRNDQIEIDWDNGSFEHATATFADPKTMNYIVVDHTDQIQINVAVKFHRQ